MSERSHRELVEPARSSGQNVAIKLISLLHSVGEETPLPGSSWRDRPGEDLLASEIRMLPADELRKVSARAMKSLADLANRQDGRPPIRMDDWRMFLICLSSSRTLREAIHRASDFYRMLDDRWGRLEPRTRGEIIEIRADSLREKRNPIAFAADLMGMAALHGLFSWMIRQPVPISVVHLAYGEDMRPYFDAGALAFPLTLGARCHSIQFPARYLDYPITRSVADYADRLLLSCSSDACERSGEARLSEQARLIMYRALRDSQTLLSLEELSSRLGRNRATVRRQLDREGLSYNQIKVSCRRELALELLRRSSVSVEEITARLGFCDSDAFRRSFRVWVGVSPSEYRKTADHPPGKITVVPEHEWGISSARYAA